ncbi:MAG: M24 family metallopeptidase [Xanthobacteraceae bacterium]
MSGLPQHLQRIVDQEYPRFSAEEMARRRSAVEGLMMQVGADHLLFCGANRFGSSVQWLTQWPVTTEAIGVLSPGKRDALFIQYFNHVPQARILAADADVAWGGESTIETASEALTKRGATPGRVAVIGPLTVTQHALLTASFGDLKNLNRDYIRLRMMKSAEELDWLRIGAHLSDLGMMALRDNLKPGINERELGNAIERAYVGLGGVNVIHFVGATQMDNPSVAVPRQFHSTRKIAAGDVVSSEISAAFWDYSGQVLRSFAVGAEPNALYRDLYAAADAAFDAIVAILKDGTTPAEVVAASRVIEQAGFTTIDDLMHGYGGGYLPPIVGTHSRPAGKIPDMPLRAGMTVVVQPNVTTQDHRAGVQTGELLLITKTGVERMHAMPRGFVNV